MAECVGDVVGVVDNHQGLSLLGFASSAFSFTLSVLLGLLFLGGGVTLGTEGSDIGLVSSEGSVLEPVVDSRGNEVLEDDHSGGEYEV